MAVEVFAGFVELLADFAELLMGGVEILAGCVEILTSCVESNNFPCSLTSEFGIHKGELRCVEMLADLVVVPVGGVEIRTSCVEEVLRRKSPYYFLTRGLLNRKCPHNS